MPDSGTSHISVTQFFATAETCGTIKRASYTGRLFHCMKTEQQHRDEIVHFGKLLHQSRLIAATDGNLSVRLDGGRFLCTPTVMSKGLMQPDDLVIVDEHGKKVNGSREVSSEIAMHLLIYRRRPDVNAVVHAHPPTATGYAAAGIALDRALCSEIIVTLGSVPLANYETPGTPELAEALAPLVAEHDAILMANHGVVSWSHLSVEDAYFKMEIIEAYCRTVVVAAQLGTPLKTFSQTHLQDLLKIKEGLGIPDPRIGLKECELCNNDEWRPGVACAIPPKAIEDTQADEQAEALVQAITDQIMSKLNT